jgi:hypothetical protein
MTRTLTALAAAATIGITALAAPTAANAQWRGHHHGGWGAPVAAGVLGGLAAGAIIGSATAPYYAPAYGAYAYGPGPACAIQRERFWDGFGWRIRHVRVCY